jgi:hypothetical protein
LFDDCLIRKYQIKTRQKNAYTFYTVTWRMCLQSKMFLLFAQLGKNANTVESELSPIVQCMEFGPSPVTVLLNQNHFQYCVLPYIFFNIIDYCLLHN